MYTLTSITKLSIWCRTVQMTTESVYKISVPASLSLIHSPTNQISSTLQQQKATFSLPASQFPFRSITQKVMIQWPVSAKRYFFFHPTSNTPLCMALTEIATQKDWKLGDLNSQNVAHENDVHQFDHKLKYPAKCLKFCQRSDCENRYFKHYP